MTNNASIIICCYNSAQKLQRTLAHVAKQRVSNNTKFEVIVVDNASTDNTGKVAKMIWEQLDSQIPLTVVCENQPGLVHARICGVKAAKYDLLIFCDDDNWLREDYVQNAIDIMNNDQNIGVLGGQSVLSPHIKAPDWWDEYQGNYAVGKQLPKTGLANQRGFLYGAGFVTRKNIAERVFDSEYPLLLTGRKGSECLSGEDWEYCQRTMLLGYNLFYSEDLFYWHDVAEERLTKEKLNQLLRSFDFSKIIGERYNYIQLFYRKSVPAKILLLFKRLINYTFAKSTRKNRKLELLKFQSKLCGFDFLKDNELDIIIGWLIKNDL